MITYSDGLTYFGKWYLQLWAESIGKNGVGITPIPALGPVDQHSQLQLYLEVHPFSSSLLRNKSQILSL